MYDPQFWIDPGVYPFLVLWGLSTGYEIETNEPHDLLYQIATFDQVRCRQLGGAGKSRSLTRDEAKQLVKDLSRYIGDKSIVYAPNYHPLINLDADFATNVFLPAVEQGGYVAEWEQWGIYHKINKVVRRADENQNSGELFTGEIMCRNHVMALLRSLEYDAVMAPFAVTYNLLKKRGSTSITWTNAIINDYPLAEAILTREKARHMLGRWRIYQDVTSTARKEEFLPRGAVRCEGWLWLRVYHPNKAFTGAEYWEDGFYEDLGELKADLIQIEHQDMSALCAIYACAYDEPLPEEEEAPFLILNLKDLEEKRHNSDVKTWPIMYRIVKPSLRKGYDGEIEEVAFGYIQEAETEEALDNLIAMVKDQVTRPPFMILLHRLETVRKVES